MRLRVALELAVMVSSIGRVEKIVAQSPNDWRISCRLSARARTNLRFRNGVHRRVPPKRRPAPDRPVGRMRGLGGTPARERRKSLRSAPE
jgi:hypothetical protein